jgi:hypothetical protein
MRIPKRTMPFLAFIAGAGAALAVENGGEALLQAQRSRQVSAAQQEQVRTLQLNDPAALSGPGDLTILPPADLQVPTAPARALPPAQAGGMVLSRTAEFYPNSSDPIWVLTVGLPDGSSKSFQALVGRGNKQLANRDTRGNESPLPKGRYQVTEIAPITAGLNPELGKAAWIGLEPLFNTGRSALGIHHDPSAGKGKESGTSGCIGLVNHKDVLELAALVRQYRIQQLQVQS